jgi:hypothetical protein
MALGLPPSQDTPTCLPQMQWITWRKCKAHSRRLQLGLFPPTKFTRAHKTCMRIISFEPRVATKYSGDAAQALKQINPNNNGGGEAL